MFRTMDVMLTGKTTMTNDGPLTDTISQVERAASGSHVSVEEIIEAVEEKGILPIILIPAIIAATPLSGIPGVTVVCGLLIALLSFELIVGFRRLVLPGSLRSKTIDGAKLRAALSRIEPGLTWIDTHSKNRLRFLFHRPFVWLPQTLCLLSGLAMPFLEIIPFSGSIAAAGVCLLVMAMLTEDGLFFILALLPYGAALYLLATMVG